MRLKLLRIVKRRILSIDKSYPTEILIPRLCFGGSGVLLRAAKDFVLHEPTRSLVN